jgi:AbrB family looped-hinge helix DNA binding protein
MAYSRKPKDYFHKVHSGGSGYGGIIYLPKEWRDRMKIVPGDTHVRITDLKDGRLVITKAS